MLILQAGTRLQDSIPARLLRADSVAQLLDRKYVGLLENVNGQLADRWSAYGVVFTVLAILVAVLTIGAGAMIIFRDREYKRQLKEVLDQFGVVSSAFLADRKQEFAKLEEQIRAKESERAKATAGEARERVEAELASLRSERQRVVNETRELKGSFSGTTNIDVNRLRSHYDRYVDFRSCSKCGYESDRNATYFKTPEGRSAFRCPYCGNVDWIGPPGIISDPSH